MVKNTRIESFPPVVDITKLENGRFIQPSVLQDARAKAVTGDLSPGIHSVEALRQQGIESPVPISIMQSATGPRAYGVYPKPLGKGAYGEVSLIQGADGKLAVQKQMKLATPAAQSGFKHEVSMISSLDGIHETAQFGAAQDTQGIFKQDYAEGMSLLAFHGTNPSEGQLLTVFKKVSEKLDELHQKGILHLDVKPDNIQVNPNTLEVRLVDFGESKQHENGKVQTTLTGTPNYMAPEHRAVFDREMDFRKRKQAGKLQPDEKPPGREVHEYSTKSDVASLGNYFRICTRLLPQVKDNQDFKELAERMASADIDSRPEFSEVTDALSAIPTPEPRVALLNIDDYAKLSTSDRAAVCHQLAGFDNVKLYSESEAVDIEQATNIHKEITSAVKNSGSHHISIDTDIVHGPGVDPKQGMANASVVLAVPRRSATPPQAKSSDLQRIPSQVDLGDTVHGRLMTQDAFDKIRNAVSTGKIKPLATEGQRLSSGRLSAGELSRIGISTSHDVMVRENPDAPGGVELEAIYTKKDVGKGAFGTVQVIMTEDGRYRALKSTEDKTPPRRARYGRNPTTEYKNLQRIGREVSECYYTTKTKEGAKSYSAISMDYVDGVPLDKADLSAGQYLKVMRDVSNQLDFLKDHGVVYSDFKPENILVRTTPSGQVEVIDFGTIVKCDNEDCTKNSGLQGSPAYMPPEFLEKTKNGMFAMVDYSQGTDIYSLGVSYAEMLDLHEDGEPIHGTTPYKVVDETHDKFVNNTKLPDPDMRKRVVDFLQRMTAKDPAARPSPDEVKQFFDHEFSNRPDPSASIGVINLHDFRDAYQASNLEERAALLDTLKGFDEVAIIVPEVDLDGPEAQQWMRVLDDAGIAVNNSNVVHGTTVEADLLAHVEECYTSNQDYEFNVQKVDIPKPEVAAKQEQGLDKYKAHQQAHKRSIAEISDGQEKHQHNEHEAEHQTSLGHGTG